MIKIPINSTEKHKIFLRSQKKHVLMITNHGIHQWKVIPGLQDTGGQNVFVNYFTQTLADMSYKITIVNRGGYKHPRTGEWQRGLNYKDENQRILYLEDNKKVFVRKEDMDEQLPQLFSFLSAFLKDEGIKVDLIISHYWDAAKLGYLVNQALEPKVKHVWVPHSLGALKKRNIRKEHWKELRINERIENERKIIKAVDGIAATSSEIKNALLNDYGYKTKLFLPPCIDTKRYYPREVREDHNIWDYLSNHSGLPVSEIKKRKIVTEISRTDTTKRKNIVISAFAEALKVIPQSLLVISIDKAQEELYQQLTELIKNLNIREKVTVVGSIWDLLPMVYAITDVYITPSIMEGFGMSAQEAAATKVPVIASNLVPFVVEYLLGKYTKKTVEGGSEILIGEGAIVAQADDLKGFTYALKLLLTDDSLREKMGTKAYTLTIPYFTWERSINEFFKNI
ncbi:MAG: glycosyltransferase [Promethearchaeota archaeon]